MGVFEVVGECIYFTYTLFYLTYSLENIVDASDHINLYSIAYYVFFKNISLIIYNVSEYFRTLNRIETFANILKYKRFYL